jgi:hypothetical protein
LLGLLATKGNNYQKNTLNLKASQGENVLGTNLGFQTKNEDLRLYSRMVLEIRQSLSTGSSFYLRRTAFLGRFLETCLPVFPSLFATRAAGAKRSPFRRLSIILLVRKLTTLLKSPGSTFPQNFATLKAFRVIPASSAMSFNVYRYSLFGLYAGWDPFLGIFTSYDPPSSDRDFVRAT